VLRHLDINSGKIRGITIYRLVQLGKLRKDQKIALEHVHPGALFWFSQNGYLKVSKKYKKYLDIVSYVHYERANFECKILCILGSAKKANWTKSERFEGGTIHTPKSAILLFLPRIEYMVCHDENLNTGIYTNSLTTLWYFSDFLKPKIWKNWSLKKWAPWIPSS
jgi:hypothetical protein